MAETIIVVGMAILGLFALTLIISILYISFKK